MEVARRLTPVLESLVGTPLPVRIKCWDGSVGGNPDAPATLVFTNRRALRRLLYAPGEMGLTRAYISGDLDIEGDIFGVLDLQGVIERLARHDALGFTRSEWIAAAGTALRLGAVGPPPPLPAEEVRKPRIARHTQATDARAVSHHYDVGNDFYRLILGDSFVYSCAYWARPPGPSYGLGDAQRDKLELICTKLGLRPGMRLLDIGCGWGSLLIHAAREHGVHGVGVTVSREQADLARKRIDDAGFADRLEVRLLDYRDITDGPFDAIASVGMSEHVGAVRLPQYGQQLYDLLRPGGRVLNHAIASVRELPQNAEKRPTFVDRYVFPDGELTTLSTTLAALERAGLEVRDSEALREHYGLTLRAWVANLTAHWAEAQRLSSPARARVWLLYMAASALGFERGGLTIHQVLAVRQGDAGASGLPRTRAEWLSR